MQGLMIGLAARWSTVVSALRSRRRELAAYARVFSAAWTRGLLEYHRTEMHRALERKDFRETDRHVKRCELLVERLEQRLAVDSQTPPSVLRIGDWKKRRP